MHAAKPVMLVVAAFFIIACAAARDAADADSMMYACEYQADAFEHAGSINLHLRNPAPTPLAITGITLDGKSVGKVWATDEAILAPETRDQYIAVDNDSVAWLRTYPNPIEPGGISEIIIRLARSASGAPRHDVSIALQDGRTVDVTIPAVEPAFRLEYVGIGPTLDEVCVYVKRLPRSRMGAEASLQPPMSLEIDGRRVPTTVRRISSRYSYALVKLSRPWDHGSFHTVAVGDDADRRAVMIRALPSPAPIGIMGNLSAPVAQQYRDHLFQAHLAFVPGRDNLYDACEAVGLRGAYIYYRRTKPGEKKYEPVYYDQPEAIGAHKDRSSLWAYFLEDEPDGRYHVTALPGLSICRDVQRASLFCRVFDPDHPTYLQIDHGSFPRGLYNYGQVPDYICAHAYALGSSRVVSSTAYHVEHIREASRPRPFYYLNCGYSTNGEREFEPDEMRLEVFTALAHGAKSFQWYPAHSARGLLAHPRMWDAVGQMNGVLRQVLPLTSMGIPVNEPRIDQDGLSGSVIQCGDRAMAIVIVNEQFQATKSEFTLTRAEDVLIETRLPRFMKVAGACEVRFPEATRPVPIKTHGTRLSFRLDVGAGAVVIVYADESVPEALRATHAACLKQFVPAQQS